MSDVNDQRVLILASGRDGTLTSDILARGGMCSIVCHDDRCLRSELAKGAGALVCAEESLTEAARQQLKAALDSQPPWSDLPILVVAANGDLQDRLASLAQFRSVSVLSRPMAIDTLITAVQSALQARKRQYEVRDLLLERELAGRRKDDFLAMLAHELRNPLAPIRYSVQILGSECDRRNLRVAQAITLVERQVAHMSHLIEDLLRVSRLTAGAVTLKLARLDLAKLAQDVAESHVGVARSKGLFLNFSAPSQPLWVDGDAVRLTQVLENLIDNSEKFSTPGGRITVGARAANEHAEVWVSDEGEGFDPQILGQLFETFTQADRSLDRSKGGLGLGLSIVHGLMQLHEGHVSAISEGPGKGATFTIRLPLAAIPTQASTPGTSGTSPGGNKVLKVLIVEDNHDSAESLRMMLKLYGHTVEVAYSGPEGIAAAMRFAPDVMLCDIGLPGMNGLQVAQAIRSQPQRPGRMVAVTGYGGAEDRIAAMAAGFDAHLVKPVSPQALIDELRKFADLASHSPKPFTNTQE
ncbi:MAG: hybrid sensor histidine kinase/response regulator [Planctomycetaceae bacterium]